MSILNCSGVWLKKVKLRQWILDQKGTFLGDHISLHNSPDYLPPYSKLTQRFLLGDVHVVGHNSYPLGSLLQR